MAQDDTPQDLMHYEAMAQDALRGVVRSALKRAASPEGLPGAHHFYITFKTDAPGVSAPPDILAKYPEEMTIVLQYQFFGLKLEDDCFGVTLSFNNVKERLRIPIEAITTFADPSVNFALQFQSGQDGDDEESDEQDNAAPKGSNSDTPEDGGKPKGKGKKDKKDKDKDKEEKRGEVISLDMFRKK